MLRGYENGSPEGWVCHIWGTQLRSKKNSCRCPIDKKNLLYTALIICLMVSKIKPIEAHHYVLLLLIYFRQKTPPNSHATEQTHHPSSGSVACKQNKAHVPKQTHPPHTTPSPPNRPPADQPCTRSHRVLEHSFFR